MKLIIKGLAILVIGILSGSSISVAQSKKDAKANQVLKSVSAKYNSLKTISVSFKVTVNDQKRKSSNSQTGSLLVKGDKYLLKLKGQDVISDGKNVWTYLKEANEVQINPVTPDDGSITPKNIFTIYEKGFSSKFTGEKKSGDTVIQQIELVPDDEKKSYFKIQLHVDKQKKYITWAKIFEKNGTHIIYSIESFKENIDAPDSNFTFNASKYPGVEVIDLR